MGILGRWEHRIKWEGSTEALHGPRNFLLVEMASILYPNVKTTIHKLKINFNTGNQMRFYNSRAVPSPSKPYESETLLLQIILTPDSKQGFKAYKY